MRPITPFAALLATALILLVSGCGDPVAPPSAETSAAFSSAPSYWLPSLKAERIGPSAGTKSGCVDQLDVELSVSGERITGALVSDEAQGSCDALVLANKRFYEMRMVAEDCGSRVYEAVLASSHGPSRLRLLDHSQRRCDERPYTLELQERHAAGTVRRYGGHWR